MKLPRSISRGKSDPSADHRRHTRLPVNSLAVVSWRDAGKQREITGNCLDLSEGGASIEVSEPLPLGTQVHLRFPDLQAEAIGEIRHSDEASIGIKFAELIYYGAQREPKARSPRMDPDKYVLVAFGLVLLIALAYRVPGLLPAWMPLARPAPSSPPAPFFTLGSTKPQVYAVQGQPTLTTEATWYYGSSQVTFRGNYVTGWSASRETPLRTAAHTPDRSEDTRDRFAVGSTAEDVLAAQGPPTELTETVWRYETGEVYFKDGKVVDWKSKEGRQLNAETAVKKQGNTKPPDLAPVQK